MAVLPQLVDAERYRAGDWDLVADAADRAYWLDHFTRHLDDLARAIRVEYPDTPPEALAEFADRYRALMDSLRDVPDRHGRLDILLLDELRGRLLREYGFDDPYRHIKAAEDAAALELLPAVLAELDALPPEAQLVRLVEGLMAGNIFDLGARATADLYHANGLDFRRTRAEQPPRPWFVDDLDAWQARWAGGRGYRHALWFVDNAGSDLVLGCLPLVRWLLGRGTRVTLAANSGAALNDITADELAALLRTAGERVPALADPGLRVVASGSAAPLIDLTRLSAECVAAAADADLLMLHGMGRSVESNRLARFTCDTLRTAVLKDEAVARHVGGRLFDCIFRFDAGAGH